MRATTVNTLTFHCKGTPAPQGSMNVGARGQVYHSQPEKLKVWREALRFTAAQALHRAERGMFTGPVEVWLDFHFLRPPSHLTSKHRLRKGVPRKHVFKPDLDKLIRAALDSFSGTLFEDDRMVVSITATKDFVTNPEYEGLTVMMVDLSEAPGLVEMAQY